MSITPAELTEGEFPPDFKRDQWGRPHIMQADGKRKGYTRCSSAAKTVEDTFNLEKWARRNIAYGLAYDSSLVARVIAIGGEPSTWGKTEKDAVNAILEAADGVAKAHKRADIGTAVHHLTHRLDRGETVNGGPYQADLDAYWDTMNEANIVAEECFIECRMVNDDLEMAGTADRIVWTEHGFRIADIKTGSTVDFGSLGWAAQLAAYAGGVLYDTVTEERLETPDIDREVGLIIHLPAGEGRCTIYEVNIAAGLEAARLANDIRAIRKASKIWLTPLTTSTSSSAAPTSTTSPSASTAPDSPAPITSSPISTSPPAVSLPTPDPPPEDWRFEAKRRYDTLNDQQRADYTRRKVHIDTTDRVQVMALLADVDPIQSSVHQPAPLVKISAHQPPTPPNEGGPVSPADVAALQVLFEQLSTASKLWTGTLIAQGNRVFPFRIKDAPTVRRYEIYRAILALAETAIPDRDDRERGLLYGATGREEVVQETLPLGAAISTLNAVEAAAFAIAATSFTEIARYQAGGNQTESRTE